MEWSRGEESADLTPRLLDSSLVNQSSGSLRVGSRWRLVTFGGV